MQIHVSARKLTMPGECPCCDGHANSDLTVTYTRVTGKRVIRHHTRGWTFPYCAPCVAHVSAWNAAGVALMMVLGAGVVIGVIAAIAAADVGPAVIVVVAAVALGIIVFGRQRGRARAASSSRCASLGASVAYLGWDGTA